MTRPSHHQVLMEAAHTVAKRGTCSRLQVGAVLVQDTRPISWGYNGAPSGIEDCDHTCNCRPINVPNSHALACESQKPCTRSVHAEVNSISFAARYGIATAGAWMYVTHMPCLKCAELIINAGITHVIFRKEYRDESGLNLLHRAGIDAMHESWAGD